MDSLDPQALEAFSAQERIAWALENFPRDAILVTSSFGADSAVFLHLLREVDPALPVGFIDTGFLFPETARHKERLALVLGLSIETYAAPGPFDPAQEHVARVCGNGPVWCVCRKVDAMRSALTGKSCWISGLRRDQSASRKDSPVLEIQAGGVHKLHPIADWPAARVEGYLREHKLPLHPLVGEGYTSIGCMPCTRPVTAGQEARSGRWLGMDREECGIHTFMRDAAPPLAEGGEAP
jgi:phosphoadenosine phosphosulfate reductase